MQCQGILKRFGAAFLFIFVLPQISDGQSVDAIGMVQRMQGHVSIVHSGNSVAALDHMAFSLNDRLVTGADARLQIMLTDDSQIMWALATHFQPHKDVLIIEGLPGNALDPSASPAGTTSRMGLDATRGPGFEGVRAKVSDAAMARAREILKKRIGV